MLTALSKLRKKNIHFIVLLITLKSESALALNEKQKSMLKQLTLPEYEELDKELKEKYLYREGEAYINTLMADVNRRKRNNFFKSKNREIAQKMGVKASDNTTKPGIPYTLLRTFNLVQAMIHYGKVESIEQIPITSVDQVTLRKSNRAASVVENYVDRLLSQRAEKTPIKDMDWISMFYENRAYLERKTSIFKAAKNKDFNPGLSNPYSPLNLQLHLLRNGEFILKNVKIIRKGNFEDGDKIVLFDKSTSAPTSPKRNSASKAREIYIATHKLQVFLNKKYPDKFKLTINDDNMFVVSLEFVAPYGWWKDAFFKITLNFDNIGNKIPNVFIKYAPKVAHHFTNKLFSTKSYNCFYGINFGGYKYCWSHSPESVLYGSDNFTVEEHILNIINCLTADFDIRSEGILSHDLHARSPQNVITKEIIDVNERVQKISKSVYVETDHIKIEESVRERIKEGEDPFFDYLVMDDESDDKNNIESISTDTFIPIEMQPEAEIVEFDYTSIGTFHDLTSEARRKSEFKIPLNIEPVVYYKNEKLDEHNFKQVLNRIRKGNKKEGNIKNKHKKRHNILTLIVKVPDYERRAFEIAAAHSDKFYIPKKHFQLAHYLRADESTVGKPIKWEIHIVENKKLAKANNMVYQYKLILPLKRQRTTERYRGGSQYDNQANIWIPTVRENMSEVEKKFALMSMYDLSRNKLKIPNNLKKTAVLNMGNNIITKSLLMPQDDKWLPTLSHLDLLLQRVEMSLLISHEDYSTAKENNVFFESVIEGNIEKNVITDMSFFIGYLAPNLRVISTMSGPDKAEIIYRIVINYLIEICVRTLLDNEFDASTGIVKQLIDKPEQFRLEDIYAANKKGISVAFNVLQITDFIFTKIVFNPINTGNLELSFYDNEVENLHIIIKSMRKIIDDEKNLIPLFLSHLLPVARHYSSDMDFESSQFLNKFTLSILEKYGSRTKNRDVQVSLQAFLKKTEQNSSFFSKEKTDELIFLFRKNTPNLLINFPNRHGQFRQTCYHCGEIYETKNPIRGKGRRTNKTTGEPKETLVRPFHKECMEQDRCIRKQVGQLYNKMKKGYPKKQLVAPVSYYNPVPAGFELIRINGDGNCMYSSIAEIFNRIKRSRQAGAWNQQKVRQIMNYNLRQIYSMIEDHPDHEKLIQELELILGIDSGMIPAILDNNIITDSTSFAESELAKLQQYGSVQLIALLVPTQGVWFPVITQGDYGSNYEIYDLNRWVNFAPNLLAILLQNPNYAFPDLSESQREILLQLLLNQHFDQAVLFASNLTIAPHQASHYLIHYPGSAALLEHFDAAVRLGTPQNREADLSHTIQIHESFEDPSKDGNNKSNELDPDSSVSTNDTERVTLQDRNPLSLMIQTSAKALLTTPENSM